MKMNKKIASIIIFVGLFGLASLALAQQIPNPLGGVGNFCQLLTNIAGYVGGFIATLGVIMIIISGILYLTSAGSPERTNTAKKALIYAIIGIAIGISAVAIKDIVLGIIGASGGSC
jgi:hypothetical protein